MNKKLDLILVINKENQTKWKTSLDKLRAEMQKRNGQLYLISQLQEITTFSNQDSVFVTDRPEEAAVIKEWNLPMIYLQEDLESNIGFYGAGLIIESLSQIDHSMIRKVYDKKYQLPSTIVQTQRLIIRESTEADFPAIWSIYQKEEGRMYFEGFSEDPAVEEEKFRAYIHYQYEFFDYGLWSIMKQETGQVIGRIGFTDFFGQKNQGIELGYIIKREERQKGYALEACQALLCYAEKQLERRQIFLRIHFANEPSLALAKKLGFSKCTDEESKSGQMIFMRIL